MSPFLEEILQNNEIEDIILSTQGLSYFKNAKWTGPLKDVICNEKNLFILSRKIADRANITLGLTQPSADSFIDFNGDHLFRAHVVVSPMSLNGTEITLRRIRHTQQFSISHFTSDEKLQNSLVSAVLNKKSVLVAGATGAGKSSLLSALMNLIPNQERVLILEDSPELPLPTPLSSKLLARANRFGFREGAEWDLSHLVFESLRMRPDRIIVGECRGPEAKAISQALMTGHKGIMTSIHAGSCNEALKRFDQLVQGKQAHSTFESKEHWDLVLHIQLGPKGERHIHEIRG
ncbi:MAG: ATPase, T2SS/T4P/T4SS family [Bdellovibrionota bacterium]